MAKVGMVELKKHKPGRPEFAKVIFLTVIYIAVFSKLVTYQAYTGDFVLAAYGILISIYILFRFGCSYLYNPDDKNFDYTYTPTVTFSVPAKNEQDNIYQAIMKLAQSDYPKDKISIIGVNDGSTDNTLNEMLRAKKDVHDQYGIDLKVINWKQNRGKREGMAVCVKRAKSEIITFVDSDSFITKKTLREMIKYFQLDTKIGAVSAHTHVQNIQDNLLTKLQSIHYFISYKVFKSAESLFGTVTCCPGCCSSYRTAYIRKDMKDWSKEKFLGVQCTYGDDRSVTNHLLKKGYLTMYSPTAHAYTLVPNKLKQFIKQQIRWKKSWTRESILASRFIWKKTPLMSFIFYTGILVTFLSPFVLVRALFIYPLTAHVVPTSFLLGMLLISTMFLAYYHIYTRNGRWYLGICYSIFYSVMLSWLMLYALPTIKDPKWGTR